MFPGRQVPTLSVPGQGVGGGGRGNGGGVALGTNSGQDLVVQPSGLEWKTMALRMNQDKS